MSGANVETLPLVKLIPSIRELLYLDIIPDNMMVHIEKNIPKPAAKNPSTEEFLSTIKCTVCYGTSFPSRSTMCANGHVCCSFCMYYSLLHAERSVPTCAVCRSPATGYVSRICEYVALSRFSSNDLKCRTPNCTFNGNYENILTHSLICGLNESAPILQLKNSHFNCVEFIHKVC